MQSDKTLSPRSGNRAAGQLSLTSHAQIRVQQRGVDREVLDCLFLYGRHEFDHFGCEILYFDEVGLNRLARSEPRHLWVKAIESRSLYAVVNSDGVVVTTGHRYRRVLRERSLTAFRRGRARPSGQRILQV